MFEIPSRVLQHYVHLNRASKLKTVCRIVLVVFFFFGILEGVSLYHKVVSEHTIFQNSAQIFE